MNIENEGFDRASYFLTNVLGRKIEEVQEKERSAVIEITKCVSKDDMDNLKAAVSPDQLAHLQCNARDIAAAQMNQEAYHRAGNQEQVSIEVQRQMNAEGMISGILNSVKENNTRVAESLGSALAYLSGSFARLMGASKAVIARIGQIFESMMKILGIVIAGSFAVGGCLGVLLTGSVGILGLSVVGVAAAALIYSAWK